MRKHKANGLIEKRARMGYFFVLPFIIGFLAFTVYPLIQSMFFSFQDITYNMDGYHTQPVGIEHYTYLLVKDPSYRLLLLNSLKDMLLNVPLIVFFSFFAANLLNQKFRGRLLARAIFFLPVILASSSVLGMNVDAIMASASGGTGIGETARETVNLSMQMQTFLKSVNLPGGFTDYVISGVKRITTIISASGVQILLFLAGLQSVTPSQLEAAHMEGANSWEIFWKITVPIVSPILLVSTLYTVIDSFTANSNPVIQAVQGKYAGLQFGMGSAMSWLYILVVFLIIGLVYGLLSKVVFYQDN
ncbi:ABC transporter permease subunit [Clostridia bacterium]